MAKVAAPFLVAAFTTVSTFAADTDLSVGKYTITPGGAIDFTPNIPLDVTADPQQIVDLVNQKKIPQAQVLFDVLSWKAFLAANWPTPEKGKPAPSLSDNTSWRAWLRKNAADSVDYAADGSDPIPAIIHSLSQIHLGFKALPRFIRLSTADSAWTQQAVMQESS